MRSARLAKTPVALEAADTLARPAELARFAASLLRTPAFWNTQLMVAVVTVLHYLPDAVEMNGLAESLCTYSVILYSFPIIYASLRLPPWGGVLTALWCVLVSAPDVVIDVIRNAESDHLIPEVTQLGTALVVAVVISRLVKEDAIARQRAEDMADQLVLLNQRVIRESIRAQEDERGRIARELHDGTAQSIVLLFQHLDRVAALPNVPSAARAEVSELQSIAGDVLDSVRRMSRDLRPSILDELGLTAGVEWLGREAERRRGFRVAVQVGGAQRRLSPEIELAAFRIAQEALTNAEKHSRASSVVVRLGFERSQVRLSVRDDGQGFELPSTPGGLATSGKLGLIGMRERAVLSGGSLEVRSAVGRGTLVTVEFPISG